MISAAHMLGGSWACSLREILKKKCNLVRFDVSLHTIWGLPQISFFTYYGGLLMSFFHTI